MSTASPFWSTAVSFTYITDLQDVSLPSDFLKFPSPISRFESPVGSPAAVLSSFWFGLEGSRSDCSPLGVSDLRSSAAGPFPPTPPWPGSNFVKYTTAPLSLCDRINCLQWRSLCRVTPDRRESSKSLITTLFLFPSAAESQKWPLEEKKQVLVSGRTEIILTIAAFSVFTGVSALSFHSSTSKRICESHWRPHKNSVWFQDNASLRVNSVFI